MKTFPPKYPSPVFVECGYCGHWHSRDSLSAIDCRADEHRFSSCSRSVGGILTHASELILAGKR